MNQIICLSNLLSGRFLQKRAMCTKLDIYVSVFYGQPTLLMGRECVSIVWRISHTSYTYKNNLLQLLMCTIMNMLGLVVGGQF